ncbi:MAG: Gfo/Idh/MocA family oxidoreductase [Planctomycetales bacterium]|nr:Gfo/Idh/MocA family oxidoreductase [Planctomycetales bacterium]
MHDESNKDLRFGLIGAGAIAQTHVQAFEKAAGVSLRAVADCRTEAAQAMAEAAGCAAFGSVDQMLDEMHLDAAIVCTPPVSHPEICIDLAQRGLHILCEKPLAVDSTSAAAMLAAANEAGVTFTMASKFRFVEDAAKARSIIASGVIGEPVLFENIFSCRIDMSKRWNSHPEISGGGVLIDNGAHSVDVARFFLGELAEVQVMEGLRIQNLPVEDTVKMFVRSASGVLGSIDLSWSVSKEVPYFVAVYGSAGTLLVGWGASKYRRAGDAEWTPIGSGYDKVDAFRRQLENFAAAVRCEEPLVVQPEDALASVHVIEAAYRSLGRGAWEPIHTHAV